jgi:hypothetical protein
MLYVTVFTLVGGTLAVLPASTHAADAGDGSTRPHYVPPLTVTELPQGLPHGAAPGLASSAVPDTGCGPAAADPVPDGEDIVVKIGFGPSFTVGAIPASWWRTPPYGDAGWQLQLRGMLWVPSLAQRAYQDGQTASLRALVEQVLAFHAQNPDPGTRTATSTANANAWGWDEGTALRRLATEDCLYAVTQDPRLASAIAAEVNVEFGPRYYGPPRYIVHNHGVWADLGVVRAADLLGRSDWATRSINRLLANAPKPWTRTGTSIEQASSYHLFNVDLWGQVVDMMTAHGVAAASVVGVRALVTRAAAVSPWLTEPDGRLVVLGDSEASAGVTRSRWTARTLRDDAAGLIVGKWSWTDPATTYYTIRYGPPRIAHGQEERAGITWSTKGKRVFVGAGKAPFDPAGNYRAWGRSPAAHNVSTADRRTLDTKAWVTLEASTIRAPAHSWATRDRLFGIGHVRTYAIVRDTRTMTVKDTYDAKAAFRQHWHLDPSWDLRYSSRDGNRLRFATTGATLNVTTTGVARVFRGVTRPVAGWNFPDGNSRVKANEIQVTAAGTAATTFVLS